jgi:hypothetical protein
MNPGGARGLQDPPRSINWNAYGRETTVRHGLAWRALAWRVELWSGLAWQGRVCFRRGKLGHAIDDGVEEGDLGVVGFGAGFAPEDEKGEIGLVLAGYSSESSSSGFSSVPLNSKVSCWVSCRCWPRSRAQCRRSSMRRLSGSCVTGRWRRWRRTASGRLRRCRDR